MNPDPTDFGSPPKAVCEVSCLHCGEVYESYQICWVDDPSWESGGYWACPTDGCSGKGFLVDILPTDDEYCDSEGRRCFFNDDEDPEWEEIMPWPGGGEALEGVEQAGALEGEDEDDVEIELDDSDEADELDDTRV